MGLFEWLFLVVIIINSYKVYKTQAYTLDRQIAKVIKYLKSLFR